KGCSSAVGRLASYTTNYPSTGHLFFVPNPLSSHYPVGASRLSRRAARKEMDDLLQMEELGGRPATWLEAAQLEILEPIAESVPMIGILAPDDEHVRPETLTAGLAKWLQDAGAKLRAGTAVDHLLLKNGQARAAVTAGGDEIEADAFVLAAGVCTRYLAEGLGKSIPLVGGKGYSLTYAGCTPSIKHPIYLSEAKVAISPYHGGVRLLGTMELGSQTDHIDRVRTDAMLRACGRYLPHLSLTGEPTLWAGMRSMVPDGLPTIGRINGAPNVVVATAHAMLGITLAPMTGELVADIFEGRELALFASAFSLDRF
ncbi:MAG: NAD(P)/FAD-dependent oxidoreductase, partial [Candidatus Dormibacteria bacterium]